MASIENGSSDQIPSESHSMRMMRRLGRDELAWPLRRLHVPISRQALVLEVGSGGNPFPRANVLLDAYEESSERHFQPLVRDRPTVLGLIENMPFRDDAFDFVIACHVVEHSLDIVACLRELQRVARAGYIETPDAFLERINPYHDHRLELTVRDGELRIRPKRAWRQDPELVEMYEAQVKSSHGWGKQLRSNPFSFHMRYFWSRDSGGIRYSILPGKNVEPIVPRGEEAGTAPSSSRGLSLRQQAVRVARELFSQSRRNREIDLGALLRCPTCCASPLERRDDHLTCVGCTASYLSPNLRFAKLLPMPGAFEGASRRSKGQPG